MKIISQTDNRMMLKDGSALGTIFGVIFMAIGIYFGYSSYVSSGISSSLWFSLVFVGVGLLAVLMNTTIAIAIDKSANQIAYQQKRLVGSTSATYNVSDVLRIETRKTWKTEASNKGAPRQVLVAQSLVIFKDGSEVPLDMQKGSSSIVSAGPAIIGGQGKESVLANQVAQFLGVPFQEVAPPNSGIGINIGGERIQL